MTNPSAADLQAAYRSKTGRDLTNDQAELVLQATTNFVSGRVEVGFGHFSWRLTAGDIIVTFKAG